jgi:hypothetical protein
VFTTQTVHQSWTAVSPDGFVTFGTPTASIQLFFQMRPVQDCPLARGASAMRLRPAEHFASTDGGTIRALAMAVAAATKLHPWSDSEFHGSSAGLIVSTPAPKQFHERAKRILLAAIAASGPPHHDTRTLTVTKVHLVVSGCIRGQVSTAGSDLILILSRSVLQNYGTSWHTDNRASGEGTHTALMAAVTDDHGIEEVCRSLAGTTKDPEIRRLTRCHRFWPPQVD